jgi:hypothetical protein
MILRKENRHKEHNAKAVWLSSVSWPSLISRHTSVARCSQSWALMSRHHYHKARKRVS